MLHLSVYISDRNGNTIGGHLLGGCKVLATAKIVILSSNQYEFKRVKDVSAEWQELQVNEGYKLRIDN